ncbi:toll/interleukin-1 receptor domain-containing protein [Bacillus sp. S13(2024)]|uniref:toll/interleukin-1 receptor domain-containing protein n=1 Tax=Bacillus sp. S13(2024) TaxID=3162885 RepID=UPI003D203C6B
MTEKLILNEEPTVFISYSWTTPEHEEWVKDLASRLYTEGVEVKFDKWELEVGNDIFAYMETMVVDPKIDKVLIICDEGYKNRADGRVGGVGAETELMSPNIYGKANQNKFIPIVAERGSNGEAFIPAFLSSRMYIDLTSDYESNFQSLMRNIVGAPLHRKPSKGKLPSYLFREEADHSELSNILRKMEVSSEKTPKKLTALSGEFIDSFVETLEAFSFTVEDANNIDDDIVEKIKDMQPLRDDYIKALNLLLENDRLDVDFIVEFFENVYPFSANRTDGQFYESQFDHFKFLINEMFLYTVSILVKNKEYKLLTEVLYSDFHNRSRYESGTPLSYIDFYFYLRSLDYRNEKLSLRRVSVHADMLTQRAKRPDEIIMADLLLYFISALNNEDSWSLWFPIAYIYLKDQTPFRFLSRLKSKSHFNDVKTIFNVDNKDVFIQKINAMKKLEGHQGGFKMVPTITKFIKLDDICTLP